MADSVWKQRADDLLFTVENWIQKKPNWKQYVGSVVAVTLVVYFFFSSDSLYFVSFLAELLRTYGILLMIRGIMHKRSVAGLSLKSQQLYVVVFLTRLLFKLFYERDYIYAFVEFFALALTLVVVYFMRFKYKSTYSSVYDTISDYAILGACAALSLFLYPNVTPSKWINMLWALSTYLEAVTLLPQIWIVNAEKRVEDATAHYIFSLFLSRGLELSFWVIALVFRQYLRMWRSLGYYVIATELIHSLLLLDFIYHFVQSTLKGTKMVLPAS